MVFAGRVASDGKSKSKHVEEEGHQRVIAMMTRNFILSIYKVTQEVTRGYHIRQIHRKTPYSVVLSAHQTLANSRFLVPLARAIQATLGEARTMTFCVSHHVLCAGLYARTLRPSTQRAGVSWPSLRCSLAIQLM